MAPVVRQRTRDTHRNRKEIALHLANQGFDLSHQAGMMPIFSHGYVLCAPKPESSAVLSVVVDDTDAIVFADSLREYLEKEFFR